ncbi:HAD family hydrolase [Pontibacter sp. JAM-7]|uniref:HAD family hydrolase n=1 Tax=Pontibacter sp. JAM-7 TaxID=3366581 RepID=UPI003AF5BC8A
MIRCITFDLDDTLWAVDPVIRQANQTLFDWLAQNAPAFTQSYQLQDLVDLRATVLAEKPEIAHSVSLIRLEQLRFGLQQTGYSDSQVEQLAQQAFAVFLHARQQVEFFSHAWDMLRDLKQQGYVLGALSNGNADIQRVGLDELMDFQFKADEVGAMKPHPLMFETMLSHTRLRPEQVIHIGDNPQHDIEGARQLGLWTIWVNLQGQCAQPVLADAHVTCLSEIPQRVAEINELAQNRVRL